VFGLSPIRLYAYAAIALFLAYLIWHERHLAHVVRDQKAQLRTAEATLRTERANTERANAAEKAVVAKLDDLERRAREQPMPRLRCRAAILPKAAGTAVPGEAAQADDAGENAPDFDPTPELDQYGTDAESNLIQCQGAIDYLNGLAAGR
jgi:cell division protein FtsB